MASNRVHTARLDIPGKYTWSRTYTVTVAGVDAGVVHNAKHSGAYGRTYWIAVQDPDGEPGKRGVSRHNTRAEAVEHLVSLAVLATPSAA